MTSVSATNTRGSHESVLVEWDDKQLAEFEANPNGELGKTLLHALAEVVLAGAKRRCEVGPTGKMRDQMYIDYGTDDDGTMYADIVSPVRSTRSKVGFPYAYAHEGKHVVDKKPHRSLRPALQDIRKILAA